VHRPKKVIIKGGNKSRTIRIPPASSKPKGRDSSSIVATGSPRGGNSNPKAHQKQTSVGGWSRHVP
jgi:hypothetical protein